MADDDALDQRAGQLRNEHDYWESVRQNAAKELQEQRENEAKEEAKSRLATAGFNLDQIAQELDRIDRLKQAAAREQDPAEALKEEFAKQEREKQEAFQKEEQQKADFQKQEAQKAEAFSKEEEQKAEAFRKEEQQKEAFAKEERDKQDSQNQQTQKVESPLVGFIETAVEVANFVLNEKRYIAEQAVLSVVDAAVDIINPVSQKEAGQYLETQQQALKDFISDEMFQGAPAEHKAMWLEEKFKELQQAEKEKFGDRTDDYNYRDNLQDNLAELQKIAMDAVEKEQKIQDRVNDEVKDVRQLAEDTTTRLVGQDEKIKQVEEIAKQREAEIRQKAEEERQRVWEKALEEQRVLADKATKTQEELARQEAKERAEAERKAREMAKVLTFGL